MGGDKDWTRIIMTIEAGQWVMEVHLLWFECLCLPKFVSWNPNPQSDGFGRWGLGEMIRSWGRGSHDGLGTLEKRPQKPGSTIPPHEDAMRSQQPASRKRALIRTWPYLSWIFSLQNCEQWIFTTYKPPINGFLLQQPRWTRTILFFLLFTHV